MKRMLAASVLLTGIIALPDVAFACRAKIPKDVIVGQEFSVRFRAKHLPTANIPVSLRGESSSLSGTTDSQGLARFDGVSPGTYRISVPIGYVEAILKVSSAGRRTEIELDVIEPAYCVSSTPKVSLTVPKWGADGYKYKWKYRVFEVLGGVRSELPDMTSALRSTELSFRGAGIYLVEAGDANLHGDFLLRVDPAKASSPVHLKMDMTTCGPAWSAKG